jgi:HlyD family secretion protein
MSAAKSRLELPLLLAGLALIGGCSNAGSSAISLKAQKGLFQVLIPGTGELQAAKSTPIIVPPKNRWRQTIAWLAPDNAAVRKGDVVVRLDATQLREQLQKEENQIAKLNLEIGKKELQLEKEKSDLQGEVALTEIERKMADVYAKRDETIFSRNEIIGDAVDLEFQTAKERHLQQKKARTERKAVAELQLLQAKVNTSRIRADQYRESLNSLELKAPHDGVWVIERTWSGEKLREGQNTYGGIKIGTLPDLNRFEARVFVLESEASGLQEKLPVSVRLDFEPNRIFRGKVTAIDTIAKSLDPESAVKYFEVRVSLDRTEPKLMKPGAQVKATIFARHLAGVIAVPNQALRFEGGKAFVSVRKPGGIEKRAVETGARSLTRTVITRGLAEGELFLLDNPKNGSGEN